MLTRNPTSLREGNEGFRGGGRETAGAVGPKTPAKKTCDLRVAALRRFAVAITILNILGHTVFGFEPSWAQLVTADAAAIGLELLLEWIQARVEDRSPRFHGGFGVLVDFLLPAHITGVAVSMLLYANDRLLPFAFAAAVAVGSKAILTVATRNGRRHYMNPSNFGLAVTYLALSGEVATVVPYQYTEDLTGYGDWLLPLIVICTGSLLNARFTKRIPLILAWVAGFALQAAGRSLLLGASLIPTLAPMTGMAFLLFTFYMAPDPGTTPSAPRRQMVFGLGVALAYGVLISFHVPFTIFFALVPVCLFRGIAIYVGNRARAGAHVRDALGRGLAVPVYVRPEVLEGADYAAEPNVSAPMTTV